MTLLNEIPTVMVSSLSSSTSVKEIWVLIQLLDCVPSLSCACRTKEISLLSKLIVFPEYAEEEKFSLVKHSLILSMQKNKNYITTSTSRE